ncbi:UNVERIFIED_ORG: hypothetical protein ABID33_000288 [Xanthobacter viscosus]|uniref:Uncharacterized protein n=1 Tax=Xanthobacter autotrophicus TaxID=280 RepID=A0A6C1KI05_XANAU|nr:hypothetical protein [Xanthobacter autotrophicus]TLX43825.1 hypothetical protein FBQ73_06915 [Xanthobacter autotrophicus]
MPSEPAPAERSPFDVSDAEIDQALTICDGDPRETIRALLVGQAFLEHEMSTLKADASAGFRRRRQPVED